MNSATQDSMSDASDKYAAIDAVFVILVPRIVSAVLGRVILPSGIVIAIEPKRWLASI